MEHLGRQEEVGIAIEGTKNTPANNAQKWLKHTTAGVVSMVSKIVDNNVRGVLEDSEGARVTKKWFEGNLEGVLHIDALGYFLASIYGAPDSNYLGDAFTHDFTVDQSLAHPTLSIFRKDADVEDSVYAGGVVKILEINAKPDDYVRFVAGIICSNESGDSTDPSYDDELDFIGKDLTIKIADTEEDLVSADTIAIKDIKIKFDTKAISDFHLGSYNPDNYNGAISIEIDITKNYIDTVFETLFKGDDSKYIEIAITGDTDISASPSIKASFVMLLNKAQVIKWSKAGNSDDLAEEKFTIKAFYNATDTQQSAVTLTNLTETYIATS